MTTTEDLKTRLDAIDLLVLDVDGVLTDGAIIVDDLGVESKHFHVRDGSALASWVRLGKRVAILSGRRAALVDIRAKELGITPVIQGASRKGQAFRDLLATLGTTADRACFVGDDLADLAPLKAARLAACPADAAIEVRAVAHLVTQAPGGRGAVREVVEAILKGQGRWEAVVAHFDEGD